MAVIVILSTIWLFRFFDTITDNSIVFYLHILVTGIFCLLVIYDAFRGIVSQHDKYSKDHNHNIEQGNKKTDYETEFKMLFEASPLPISITDYETGKFFDVNKKLCEVSGFSKEDLIGEISYQMVFLKKKSREKILDYLKNKNDDSGLEMEIKIKGNHIRNCIVYPFLLKSDNKDAIITIISDITNIKTTQNEIKKLSTAIEQSANTVIITNSNAEIEYANPYFTNLTGYSLDEVIGKNPDIQKSGIHTTQFYKDLWDTILKGEKWTGEFYNKKKNGDYYWESATITPILDEKGNITNFLAIKEDITERKKQQEALELSEKKLSELNATKDKFFSIIAHDLMNPISALLGFSKLSLESTIEMDFEKSLKYLTQSNLLVHEIADLLQHLLLWSRTQTGKIKFQPQLVNVNQLINETLNLLNPLAQKKEIGFLLSIPSNTTSFFDYNMVSTIIRNIISNAIKFSYKGGQIEILVEKHENETVFKVSDHGKGIEPATLNRLFSTDRDVSSKGTDNETGTGLGLVISKEFIEIHKGEIKVESEIGKGSCFYFSIPVKHDDKEAEE